MTMGVYCSALLFVQLGMKFLAGLVGRAIQAKPTVATLALRGNEQDAGADTIVLG